VRAQQKMDVLPGVAEFRAVITSHGSRTDDGYLHGCLDCWMNGLMDWGTASVRMNPFIQLSINPTKKALRSLRVPLGKSEFYFAPRMASFAALATWNFTTRLAGIWICSPVAGLRPMRAARFLSFSLPRPGSVKVFLAFL